MKRHLVAAALAGAALCAHAADTPEVPKPRCEQAPRAPGRQMREDEFAMKRFKREVKAYQDCMKAYIEERQAVLKANQDAANAAADQYNKAMSDINEGLKSAE
jgi:hypothetical protein